MNITPLRSWWLDIWNHIENSEENLAYLWIEIREEYTLTQTEISHIHRIANEHSCLQWGDEMFYIQDAENGIIKLYKWKNLLGYIFAHSGEIDDIKYYERGSLWVSECLQWHSLWKYLMIKMTKKLWSKKILSVTWNKIVQSVNEIIMDYEVTKPKWILKEMIENRWKMKSNYRYFINEQLMQIL